MLPDVKVIIDETLDNANKEVDARLYIPQPPNKETLVFIDTIGWEAYNAILTFEHIKRERGLSDTNKPHVLYQFIRDFVSAIITENPNHIHFDIIKAAIEEINPEWNSNTSIRDDAARELIKQCKKFKLKISSSKKIQDFFQPLQKEFSKEAKINGSIAPHALEIICLPFESDEVEALFEKNGMFIWDWALLDLLKNIGKNGAADSKEGSEYCRNRLKEFKDSKKDPLKFWMSADPNKNTPFHQSQALIILAKTILRDIIWKREKFKEKNVAALTKNVQDPLKKMLSPKNQIIQKDQELQLFHQEHVLGTISIPTISDKIINNVFNGIKKLNTVTGHRLVRYFPKKAFDQKINGNSDYRILKYDRGATEIAEELGLNAGQHVKNIKEILHAMAYFEFSSPHLSGNLIQLSKYKSPKTHRLEEAFLINVGTPLLPYQTFEDGGLLIPLLTDPPLVNPNQYHAAQYLLQMEIMTEFSNQSIILFQENAIEINQKMWESLAQTCGISPEVLKKVKDRWIQDGGDGAKFLEKLDENYYTLGPDHQKALDFLKEQGSHRKLNSERGIASAKKRSQVKMLRTK